MHWFKKLYLEATPARLRSHIEQAWMVGDIELEWLEQEAYFRSLIPTIYDPESGTKYPIIEHRFKPFIDELQVWMEREQLRSRLAQTCS